MFSEGRKPDKRVSPVRRKPVNSKANRFSRTVILAGCWLAVLGSTVFAKTTGDLSSQLLDWDFHGTTVFDKRARTALSIEHRLTKFGQTSLAVYCTDEIYVGYHDGKRYIEGRHAEVVRALELLDVGVAPVTRHASRKMMPRQLRHDLREYCRTGVYPGLASVVEDRRLRANSSRKQPCSHATRYFTACFTCSERKCWHINVIQ